MNMVLMIIKLLSLPMGVVKFSVVFSILLIEIQTLHKKAKSLAFNQNPMQYLQNSSNVEFCLLGYCNAYSLDDG